LPVIPKLFARLEAGDVRDRKLLAIVSATLEHGANQVLVLPGEAAKQNRNAVAFLGCKRSLDGTVEVTRRGKTGLLPQAGSFGREALFDFLILLNLYQSRCHVVSFSGLSGMVLPKLYRSNVTERFRPRRQPSHSARH
jgi:hypothetical protein